MSLSGIKTGTLSTFFCVTLALVMAKDKPQKVRATFHLPADIFEEARDAVVYLSGPPVRLTLAALAESAIRRELNRLRKLHNDGEPFPRRQEDLKGGRPIRK